MTKRDLKRIILLAFLAMLLVGFTFFRKDTKNENYKNQDAVEQKNVLEKQKAENMLSNFAVTYNSYTSGDFSNIESLYGMMTEELKKSETEKVSKLKLGDKKEYQTIKSDFKGSNTIEFSENKIIANIVLLKQIYGGAYKSDPDNNLQKILVDREGKPYDKDISTLLESKDLVFLQLTGVRENEDWKVNEIKDITDSVKTEYQEEAQIEDNENTENIVEEDDMTAE